MFHTLKQQEDWFYVVYAGNDTKDLLAFYQTIHSQDKSKRFMENGIYWVASSVYELLLKTKTELKLMPYDYQQEAIDFALSKCSSLMLLPCGAGN